MRRDNEKRCSKQRVSDTHKEHTHTHTHTHKDKRQISEYVSMSMWTHVTVIASDKPVGENKRRKRGNRMIRECVSVFAERKERTGGQER